jgi:dodecin
MTETAFGKVEFVGTSATSIEDAVNNALARASRDIVDLRWFEVVETRGNVDGGKVAQWQVTVKIGHRLAD